MCKLCAHLQQRQFAGREKFALNNTSTSRYIRKNNTQRGSGAVPEPHLQCLLFICLDVQLFADSISDVLFHVGFIHLTCLGRFPPYVART